MSRFLGVTAGAASLALLLAGCGGAETPPRVDDELGVADATDSENTEQPAVDDERLTAYAAVACAPGVFGEYEDGEFFATWGEASEALLEAIEVARDLSPPTEYERWHAANLVALNAIAEHLAAQPRDDVFNPFELLGIGLVVADQITQAQRDVPDHAVGVLAEHGCDTEGWGEDAWQETEADRLEPVGGPETESSPSFDSESDIGGDVDAGDGVGSRGSPVEAGVAAPVGDWDVTVLSAVPDATAEVLAENQFNEPPGEGRQFFMVEIAATYWGDDSESVWSGLTVSALGQSSVAYQGFEDSCGVIPGEIDETSEVFPGGSVRGFMCWQVRAEDAASLVLFVEEAFSFEENRVFMSIPPPGVVLEAPAPRPGAIENTGVGSRGSPVEAGVAAPVGDWDVTVLSAVPDATAEVLAENQFNEPPGEGRQFFMVEIAATYWGDDSESVWSGLTVSALGQSSVAYQGFEDSCGVIPGEIDETSEVFPGGSVRGFMCWQVRAEDAASLVLFVEEAFSFEENRVFMSIPPLNR